MTGKEMYDTSPTPPFWQFHLGRWPSWILASLCIGFCNLTIHAQDLPSLQRQVDNTEGLPQLQARNQLAQLYLPSRPDQAFIEAKTVLKDANKVKSKLGADEIATVLDEIIREEARAHLTIGQYYEQNEAWLRASRSYQTGVNNARKIGDQVLISEGQAGKKRADENRRLNGIVGTTVGTIDEFIRTGAEEANKTKTAVTANTLHQLGLQFEKAKQYDQALDYFQQEVDLLAVNLDTVRLREVYMDMARVSEKAGRLAEAGTYYAKAKEDAAAPAPPIAEGPDTNQSIIEIGQEALLEAHRAIVGASGEKPTPVISSEDKAERVAIVQGIEEAVASGNSEKAIEGFNRLMALQDRIYQMREDSMAQQKIVDTYVNELTIFEQQQQLLMRDRQLLILGLILFVAIGGLLAFLFLSKRNSNRQLTQANTDLAQTIRQLQDTQTQLVAAEKMASLGQLTAGIAHEINNPVNFIAGNILPLRQDIEDLRSVIHQYEAEIERQGLQDQFTTVESHKDEIELGYINQEIDELIGGIDEGATRTTEIVLGLRNFARLDEAERKAYQVDHGLDSTLSLLRNQLAGIEVIKDYGAVPQFEAYPGKLNQVFMNILTNAIQAMPEGGTLRLKTSIAGNQAIVSIQDTGVGMSKEVSQRVFEPFFTTKDVGEGTGLGMSITHGIIEQHQGTIAIKSEEGLGTEIKISLPLHTS